MNKNKVLQFKSISDILLNVYSDDILDRYVHNLEERKQFIKGFNKYKSQIDIEELIAIVNDLLLGLTLSSKPPRKNHKLTGKHKTKYDVHIRTNKWLLVYSITKTDIILYDIGTHDILRSE